MGNIMIKLKKLVNNAKVIVLNVKEIQINVPLVGRMRYLIKALLFVNAKLTSTLMN